MSVLTLLDVYSPWGELNSQAWDETSVAWLGVNVSWAGTDFRTWSEALVPWTAQVGDKEVRIQPVLPEVRIDPVLRERRIQPIAPN